MKRILVIGGNAQHMYRWVKYVSSTLPTHICFDMFCTIKNNQSFEGACETFYPEEPEGLFALLNKIPKVRVPIINRSVVCSVKKLLLHCNYSALIIHQPYPALLPIIKCAKEKGKKVVIVPWGSDVLRISSKYKNKMNQLFNLADIFTSGTNSFADKIADRYDVDLRKLRVLAFGSEVIDYIKEYSYSRNEIRERLSIPEADYYIACGYNGDKSQRHINMIEAIGANIDILPKNTILLFQFTYGDNTNGQYIDYLSKECEKYNLRYFFLTTYLTVEEVAMYRDLVDMFIHIQPTDAANASLQEFLLAGAECINGEWLKYPQLEEFGIPYYVCKSLEDLPHLLCNIFSGKSNKISLDDRIKQYIICNSWSFRKKEWGDFIVNL